MMLKSSVEVAKKTVSSLLQFQGRFKEKLVTVGNLNWRIIDTADHTTYQPNVQTLILLPGTQGSPSIFWNQIDALQKDIRIISCGYPPISSCELLAKSLGDLISALNLSKPYILGSSLGGYIAQIVGLNNPELIGGLFLANTMADARPLVSKRMPSATLEKLNGTELKESIYKRIDSFPEPDAYFTAMKGVLKNTVSEQMTVEEIKARFMALDNCNLLPKMKFSEEQIFIIDANDDFVMPEESKLELRQMYPTAKRHTFSSGGHFPYITRPDEYTSFLKESLALKNKQQFSMSKTASKL